MESLRNDEQNLSTIKTITQLEDSAAEYKHLTLQYEYTDEKVELEVQSKRRSRIVPRYAVGKRRKSRKSKVHGNYFEVPMRQSCQTETINVAINVKEKGVPIIDNLVNPVSLDENSESNCSKYTKKRTGYRKFGSRLKKKRRILGNRFTKATEIAFSNLTISNGDSSLSNV